MGKLCNIATRPRSGLDPPWLIAKSVTMKLRKVSGCEDKACPTVYVSDRGTAVVQGDHVHSAEGLTLGEGETAVELPPEIILNAVSELVESGASPDAVQRLREALK